jgi:hypothetical protein
MCRSCPKLDEILSDLAKVLRKRGVFAEQEKLAKVSAINAPDDYYFEMPL